MSPDQMPGDYTVALPAGGTRVMESYGAGSVEITASGNRFNLKPGATAQVTIPVDPAQIAAGGPIPPTIPILFYDEVKGVWKEEGQATLQFVNAKQAIDILGQIEARVCSQHVMPHAKRTHDLFWLSTNRPDTPIVDPHQPGILEAFGTVFGTAGNGWQGDLCGAFTPAGPPVPSAFNDIKSQIFTPLCSSCHAGGSPPGNLNLQAGNAYTQLLGGNGLGAASCERPAMKRVAPTSANNSYLFRKVKGDHTGLGGCNVAGCNPFGGESGCGQQMPWSNPANGTASANPLSQAQLDLIKDWINAGAQN